jgi:EAL domain-containing protein (putative c-di-GMP-specific phosphodiesterase class I)
MQIRDGHLTLAVNISAVQFAQSNLVKDIAEMLDLCSVDASRLKPEITESFAHEDIEDVVRKIYGLKALGVTMSIDDFGTGCLSLSALKRLPVNQIKIDQSLVRGITSEQSDYVIVKTIIEMAKNFRMHVIAECVKTEALMSLLKHLECELYQGYFLGKPMPIAKFSASLPNLWMSKSTYNNTVSNEN